jgi:hypothetical protein
MMACAPASTAAPLDAATCLRLKAEVQGLEREGVRETLARGPQSGRALGQSQLEKVRLLMDLDGQIRFRCGGAPFVALKEEPKEEPGEAETGQPPIDAATPGITLPAGGVVPPVKPRPAAVPPEVKPVAIPTGAAVPKSKKKPADDAYRPPSAPVAPKAAPSAPGPLPLAGAAGPLPSAAPKTQP